jgi:hypothetical protein
MWLTFAPPGGALVARVAARLARRPPAAGRPRRVLRRAEELAAALAAAAAPAPDLAPLRLRRRARARARRRAPPATTRCGCSKGRPELEHVHAERTRARSRAAARRCGPAPTRRGRARERLERAQVDAWLPILDQARLCSRRRSGSPGAAARRRVRLRSARRA